MDFLKSFTFLEYFRNTKKIYIFSRILYIGCLAMPPVSRWSGLESKSFLKNQVSKNVKQLLIYNYIQNYT